VNTAEAVVAETSMPEISFSTIERVGASVERLVEGQGVDGVVDATLDERDDLACRQREAEVSV